MKKKGFSLNCTSSNNKGAVAITVAFSLLALLGVMAFAVDIGYLYVVRGELQNAADAGALAGGAVLFTSNENCLASGRPYACCTASGSGSCSPDKINVGNSVVETAKAVVAKNNPAGNQEDIVVEIGHYEFPDTWGGAAPLSNFITKGANAENITYDQMSSWQGLSFKSLNSDHPEFINAVRVTVTRTDIPRFLSRIWSPSDLRGSVQAIAYVGFAGGLEPEKVDQPLAICKQSIYDEESKRYICNTGAASNDGNDPSAAETAAWTDYVQSSCGTASVPTIKKDLLSDCNSAGNDYAIVFDQGISTTNGDLGDGWSKISSCWKQGGYDNDGDGDVDWSIDKNGDGKPEYPWRLRLPVVDCDGTSNCRNVEGVVVVNVVWINDEKSNDYKDNNDQHPWGTNANNQPWVPTSMYNPITGSQWTCDQSVYTPSYCWEDFVSKFHLAGNNNTSDPKWARKKVYFLTDCTVHAPTGQTGSKNFGILAQFPKLVK